jgi:hypothetical protein
MAKIESHNQTKTPISIGNVEYRGVIQMPFKVLIEAFGEPKDGDLYRVDVEWHLRVTLPGNVKSMVRVYNYKIGKSAMGEDGFDLEDNPVWLVASSNYDVRPMLVRHLDKMKRKMELV